MIKKRNAHCKKENKNIQFKCGAVFNLATITAD